MNQQTYIMTFDDVSPVDANRYAEELRNALLDATADITVQRRRDDPRALDFGASLVLILGTPASVSVVTAVATTIRKWLALRKGTISITTEKGEIIKITSTNLTGKEQLKMLEIFVKK